MLLEMNENKKIILISTSIALIGGLIAYKQFFSKKNCKKQKKNALIDSQNKNPFELIEKEALTHDTTRFRFALPSQDHFLGIELGHHISLSAKINGDLVIRSYTPTSSIDDKGYFDLVLKIYKANSNENFPNGGKMSQYLDSMKIGDTIDVRGPVGRMVYKRNGKFNLKFEKLSPLTHKIFNNLGMIAGGTGITPMYQLIKDITSQNDDKTKISLIFSNKTENDILLRDTLNELSDANSDQFKLWYTISKSVEPNWNYDTGHVNEEMFIKHLPPPGEDTLILMCGPKAMVKNTCLPILEKLGYTKEMLFVC